MPKSGIVELSISPLERLVQVAQIAITEEKPDTEALLKLVAEVEKSTMPRQLQEAKNQFLLQVVGDVAFEEISASLTTIVSSLFYLRNQGLGIDDVAKAATRFPLLGLDVEHMMKPRVVYLLRQGVKREDIGRIIRRFPQFLAVDIELAIKPLVKFLLSQGVKENQIGIIIARHPPILGYNLEQQIKPKARYFFDELQGTVRTLVSFPTYFSYSLKGRIMPRAEFLRSKQIKVPMQSLLIPSDDYFAVKVARSMAEEYRTFKQAYARANGG